MHAQRLAAHKGWDSVLRGCCVKGELRSWAAIFFMLGKLGGSHTRQMVGEEQPYCGFRGDKAAKGSEKPCVCTGCCPRGLSYCVEALFAVRAERLGDLHGLVGVQVRTLLHERYGITDPELIVFDPWSLHGTPEEYKGRRLMQVSGSWQRVVLLAAASDEL